MVSSERDVELLGVVVLHADRSVRLYIQTDRLNVRQVTLSFSMLFAFLEGLDV